MSVDWLQDLEEKVRETAERLAELRKENGELREQNGVLKTRLEELESGNGSGWEQERAEVRERVEKLAGHLEKLLAE